MTVADAHIWLGAKQIELYRTNPGVYVDAFCNGEAMREIISNYYRIMVKREKLKPIESMDEATKTEIKEMAISEDFSNGRLDYDGAMAMCKLIHILNEGSK